MHTVVSCPHSFPPPPSITLFRGFFRSNSRPKRCKNISLALWRIARKCVTRSETKIEGKIHSLRDTSSLLPKSSRFAFYFGPLSFASNKKQEKKKGMEGKSQSRRTRTTPARCRAPPSRRSRLRLPLRPSRVRVFPAWLCRNSEKARRTFSEQGREKKANNQIKSSRASIRMPKHEFKPAKQSVCRSSKIVKQGKGQAKQTDESWGKS